MSAVSVVDVGTDVSQIPKAENSSFFLDLAE